jgi:cell division protein FtsI (penicillin-binding protein 3)
MSINRGFALWKKKNHTSVLETLRTRIIFAIILGFFMFGIVVFNLVDIMMLNNSKPKDSKDSQKYCEALLRGDIVDRNGLLLATSISTYSCYIDPSSVIDEKEIADKLSKVRGMPTQQKILDKLENKEKKFVWIARHIAPEIQQEVMDLGLPGVYLKKEYKRFYPHGNLFSHLIGMCDVDQVGISGIESKFNKFLSENRSNLTLTLDLRLQQILHESMSDAVEKYKAEGGNAILMKPNGEILAMVSLPDFNPNLNQPRTTEEMFNRNTLGTYELGSVMKIINTAIALENKTVSLSTKFDASSPIKIGRFKITDYGGRGGVMDVSEAFVRSSNICAVKIYQTFGRKVQMEFMKMLRLFDKQNLGIPEVEKPPLPRNWSETTAMTASYGYGMLTTPLNFLDALRIIISGCSQRITLIKDPLWQNIEGCNEHSASKKRIISDEVSRYIRKLMKEAVLSGTARKAAVEGMNVIGKTGTSYMIKKHGGGYDSNRRITTIVGAASNEPTTPDITQASNTGTGSKEITFLATLHNPHETDGVPGPPTAGKNVALTASEILRKVSPMLDDVK